MSKLKTVFYKLKHFLEKRHKRRLLKNLEPPNLFPEGIRVQPKEVPKPPSISKRFKDSRYRTRYDEVLFDRNRKLSRKSSQDVEFNFNKILNNDAHRTSQFASAKKKLIVRRGQGFEINLHFKRRLKSHESLRLEFAMKGFKPALEYGTLVYVQVEDSPAHESDSGTFRARIVSKHRTNMIIEIETSFDCNIGLWKFGVCIIENFQVKIRRTASSPIYVLFNPWCEDDEVYMEEKECEEYVLGEIAYIYGGTIDDYDIFAWAVDQYDPDVLECAFYLLRSVYKLPAEDHCCPILVSRAIASAVNGNDNGGVLAGNWDSKEVSKFDGSGFLIREYYRTKRSVGPAQCWVFAGVYLTIARALGIPCRLITGYQTCISNNYKTLLASEYYLSDGTRQSNYAVWNFHAWCEIWMIRRDIDYDGRFDGWQICDGTPQVSIDGMFRIGPLSRTAVKYGHIKKPFNTVFSYAQTNSDMVTWHFNVETNKWTLVKADSTTIGAKLVTNRFGAASQEDVTLDYKFEEGSERERAIMKQALKLSGENESLFYVNNFFDKLDHALLLKPYPATYGQDIVLELSVSNKSQDESISTSGTLLINIAAYNGSNDRTYKSIIFNLEVPPSRTKIYSVPVTYKQYRRNYHLHETFCFRCIGHVREKDHYFTSRRTLVLSPPKFEAIIPKTPSERGQEILLKFQNPLPKPLRKCQLHVKNSVTKKEKIIKLANIQPGSEASFSYKIEEENDLDKLVIWTYFNSKELKFSANHLKLERELR